jgi:hypothetical protein
VVYRQSFRLGDKPLETHGQYFFQLNNCGHCPYVKSSLTRGWVYHLYASAVILRSESRGTHDHILLSQFGDSPNLEGQVPVFISHRNRVAQLYPQAPGSHFFASYDSQGYSWRSSNPPPHGLETLIIAGTPRYTASARTAQKTPALTDPPFLRVRLLRPLPRNGCCKADMQHFNQVAQFPH